MRFYLSVCFLLGCLPVKASLESFSLECSEKILASQRRVVSFERIQVKNIESILDFKEALSSKSIGIVFDIDGTLTRERDPKESHTVTPKGDIQRVISFLKVLEVPFVISSAWNVFSETLEKLNLLGLVKYVKPGGSLPIIYSDKAGELSDERVKELPLEVLNIDEQYVYYREEVPDQGIARLHDMYDESQKVSYMNYISRGINVASVRLLLDRADPFYRQKALAPFWTNARKKFEKIEEIWLFDDSPANIKIFQEDIEEFINHYPTLEHVKLFQVSANN